MFVRASFLLLLLLLGGCPEAETPALAPPPALDLSDVMLKLQVHAGKLAFAAEGSNWDLARFYVDQVEEDVQPLLRGGITVGTTDISEIATTLFPPLLERLREAALDRDPAAFDRAYVDLLQGCNSCHRSSGHAYLVIQRPPARFLENQRYD